MSVTFICNVVASIVKLFNQRKNLFLFSYNDVNILCLLANSTEGANPAAAHINEWLCITACSDSGHTYGPSIQGREVW